MSTFSPSPNSTSNQGLGISLQMKSFADTVSDRCMRQSQLFVQARKNVSKEDPSVNAQLLTKAGYIARLMSGVYTMLPLGNRVLTKIENIIRREMAALGAAEITMPVLHPKENWETTNRWNAMEVLFKLKGHGNREMALGPTHEEIITPLVGDFITSYKDLPTSVFQIQTKFRNEARAKSGLLRGREFRMKDLYSFHLDQNSLDDFYDRTAQSYTNVFKALGLGDRTYMTYATGGAFSRYSHEFQTVTQYGEDTIYVMPGRDLAINKELLGDQEALAEILPPGMTVADLREEKSIEVGNIFKLGTRFSDAFDFKVTGPKSEPIKVVMGCYGIGSSRLMGTIVECLNDENGLRWPATVAPFQIHVVSLARDDAERQYAEKVFESLARAGFEVLYDDRPDVSAGQKFVESDLLGIPVRVVASNKSMRQGGIEIKSRGSKNSLVLSVEDFIAKSKDLHVG